MNDYASFLASKRLTVIPAGFTLDPTAINPACFPFQRDTVRWGLHLGRSAFFQERGLGKTIQELEWALQVHRRTGGKVLILAPLAVAYQTGERVAQVRLRGAVRTIAGGCGRCADCGHQLRTAQPI